MMLIMMDDYEMHVCMFNVVFTRQCGQQQSFLD